MAEVRDPRLWHHLAISSILRELNSSHIGLSELEAAERRDRYGLNILPEIRRRPALRRFIAQFNNVLIYFLLAAAAAAAGLGHLVDAGVIVAVVILNALVGFIQEGRAEQALDAIRELIAPDATVLREGQRTQISAQDLVPGDLVLLEAGDRVPADIRLLRARGLLIDEAPLTGESVAAEKDEIPAAPTAALGDRRCMAFSGTLVAAGQGAGVVVETGLRTEVGQISGMLQTVEPLNTPLLRQIDSFARRFTWLVLFGGVALFAFAVSIRGFAWVDALIAVVALAVGVIPEGLPAVITVTLAIGVKRMAARNAVIRKLPAVETLGATSVICTDKTGTLTRNEMTVRRIMTTARDVLVSGSGYAPTGVFTDPETGAQTELEEDVLDLVRCGILCSDAALRQDADQWRVHGDPMEGALLALGAKANLAGSNLRAEWTRLDEIPFDAAHRFMATMHRSPAGEVVVFLKGAAEAVCERATRPFDPEPWNRRIAVAGEDGERVLAFGMKRLPLAPDRLAFADVTDGVEFLGLVGFVDPPRPETKAAIAECRSAQIAVKMITGDHAATALAVARQIEIADHPQALTGAEIERLSDAELGEAVERVSVFARTSPAHKLRIVRALQANGHIVAMTGDGVNDAPSLKQADVGVAMGIKGTEASKEAAQMVLLDDNFASIVSAIREGRTVHDNIRKVITFEVPTNGAECLTVVLAMLFGFALPMSAIQILWSNLILAATLAIVLAFEPPEPGVMQRRPRAADSPLLSPFLIWRVALISVLLGAAALGVFFHALHTGRDLETARTMVVNLFVVAEIFYLFNVRYLHMTSLTWRGALGTPAVLAAIALLVVAQTLFTYAPFMQAIFASRPLSFQDGALLIGIGAAIMVFLEVEKLLMRKLGWFPELRS